MDTQIKITPKIDSSENEFYNVLSHFSESEIQFLTDRIQSEMEKKNENIYTANFSIFGKDNEPNLNIKIGTHSETTFSHTFFSTVFIEFVSLRLQDIVVNYPKFEICRQGTRNVESLKIYLKSFNK